MGTWPDSGYTPFRCAKGSTWRKGSPGTGYCLLAWADQGGRVSDGLFDLTDLFNTSIAIAGASGGIPNDRYIDGIDQRSFLLADNGQSNRKFIYYWLQDKFSALRVGEWKMVKVGTQMTPGDTVNPGGLRIYCRIYVLQIL